ncbi:TPA: hypothetical protein ACKP1B_000158 [Serratia fonticola]
MLMPCANDGLGKFQGYFTYPADASDVPFTVGVTLYFSAFSAHDVITGPD